ncbi:MAG: hypothetical protein H6620_09900 [Halobacteriovoraceae bacterium]|nr:hypothetical protein [Halobacteriovoraceae bacterium]
MTGIALGLAETAVCYAFPQLGAAVQVARYARTAYNVAKISVSVFTGDIVGAASGIALEALRARSCEDDERTCVMACHAFNGGMEAGACLVGCRLAYLACKARE